MNIPDVLRRHEGAVFALCWRVLRHRQDAEDAAQEVLLKAARELPRLGDPARLAPWLHRVALNAALDARRRRERRIAREDRASALALPATPEEVDRDALHRALALLDDDDRAVVVEHYFHRRTLREIADAEGCSEPAVWKRVERAKEKLRKGLAAAAPSVLPRMDALLAEPAPLLQAVAPAAAAAKVAVVLALFLGGGAGAAAWFLRGGEEPSVEEVRSASVAAPANAVAPARPAPAPVGAVEPAAPAVGPYPFRYPPSRWPEAKRGTWSSIRKTRVTIDLMNTPLNEVLADITRQSGQGFRIDADVQAELQMISFRVSDIQVDGALKLMLQPREFGHVVLDDGAILVAREASLEAYRDGEERRIRQVLADLDQIRERVEAGWNGADPYEPMAALLGDKRVALGGEPDTLAGFMERLKKAGVFVSGDHTLPREDLPRPLRELYESEMRIAQEEMGAAFQGNTTPDARRLQEMDARIQERARQLRERSLDRRALGLTGERPLKDWIERIAAEWGLGWYPAPDGGSVYLSSLHRAEESRREAAAARSAHLALVGRLNRPLPAERPAGVPGLVDALSRELGLELIPSEAAWGAALPAGATWRELLDGLAARGLRWAARDGKLFLIAAP